MKHIFLITTILLLNLADSVAVQRDSLLVMFWNLENFFDYMDSGGGDSDSEFSSMGQRRWTKKRFYSKCDLIAKTIFWIKDSHGKIPDVIGVAEVENSFVLKRLLQSTLLRKTDYSFVHYDSPDHRGIDVALFYRKEVFDYVGSRTYQPESDGKPMMTRDILLVSLRHKTEGKLNHYIVNHHPSKFGGAEISEKKRYDAMNCLSGICDSLKSVCTGEIVAMGDFNDTPSSGPIKSIAGLLVNKGLEIKDTSSGTIRYEGRWELIDMFLVSHEIAEKSRMEIGRIPFLMTTDKKYPGEKPLRTYSGPRHLGGVSDHCPVFLKISCDIK